MTIREIVSKHSLQIKEIRKQLDAEVNARLRELRLDGLVRRKKDGKVGKLFYSPFNGFEFHPLLKSGEISYRQSGMVFASEVEDNYEPAEEQV